MDKKELRKSLIIKRDSLKDISLNICKQIIDSHLLDNAKTIGIYYPLKSEISVLPLIDTYKDKVLAYKMPGAGGGGYLACVVKDAEIFVKEHQEAIRLTIRRSGM